MPRWSRPLSPRSSIGSASHNRSEELIHLSTQHFEENQMKNLRNKTQKLVAVLACALFLGVCASAVSAKDLNGYYESDDGGSYFIRQIGNKIYWFAEDPHGAWANLMTGTTDGKQIHGRFWDIPKGKTKGMGEITLTISNDGGT